MATPWLRYANQGATRNQPLDPQLAQSLSYLQDLGITAQVYSGGQPAKGSGLARVGSTRHDHGRAADVLFFQGDRQLDWSNPQDVPVFQEIVKRGREAGLTGFGAGPGYMQPGSMHVGFGTPGVWGAGGRAANAPDWLHEAFNAQGNAGPAMGSMSPARPVQQASAAPLEPGSPAPPLDRSRNIPTRSVMPVQMAGNAPPPAPSAPQAPSRTTTAEMMALMGSMAPQQPQFQPAQIMGPSPEQANALSSFVAALKKSRMA